MLRVVIAVNDDLAQSIVNMYISAPLTNKVLQELGEQAQAIPVWESKISILRKSNFINENYSVSIEKHTFFHTPPQVALREEEISRRV